MKGQGGDLTVEHDPQLPNEYSVRVSAAQSGWEVQILRPDGSVGWARHCAGEAEARTFASTVQQHVYWLSQAKFREYYRIDEPVP
jgi:hypothetical protein